ncbi:MAG: sensor domain-containing diguanylate cyclase [Gemmatimonadota bacterium]|nr:sensor domain-containing diguanylate cyclase [Gemmatimonadota bacterium]MDH3423675.1 sensor domain-containing diguanylate cyclase [Gemmatimonadota bacterium]
MIATKRIARGESERIQALHDLSVLDTPPEERFDRLTRLARRVFDVPIALVSLVDTDRQWFKSHDGLDASETPREWSFCSHAIRGRGTMIVPDALSDIRFRDNPLVREDPAIRFYAGHPITAPGGSPIGTVCIIDREPRVLDAEDQALLADIANLVEREFAALRLATIDELTGLSNRRGFNMLARHALAMCERAEKQATLLVFDLDGFKLLNDTLGHAAGDIALASFAADLLAAYRESDVVARLGGDEFCVLLTGTTADAVPATLAKLAERVASRNVGREPVAQLRYSVGSAAYEPRCHLSISDLVEAADALMYGQKRSRR